LALIDIECTCGSASGRLCGAHGADTNLEEEEEGSRKKMRNMFVSGDQRHVFDLPDSCNDMYGGMCMGNTRKRRFVDEGKSSPALTDIEVEHKDKQPRCSGSDIVLDEMSSGDDFSDDGSDQSQSGVGSIRVHLPEGYHRVVSSHPPHACFPPRDASLWAIVPYVGVSSKDEEQKQNDNDDGDLGVLQNEIMNSESMMLD